MKNLICFDLDGTLIDSSYGIKLAFQDASIDVYNVEVDFQPKLVGPTIDLLHDFYFDKTNIIYKEKFIHRFRFYYDNKYFSKVKEYKNVSKTLKTIFEIGKYEMVIFTNKPLKPTSLIINQLCLNQYFTFVSCIDSCEDRIAKNKRVEKYFKKYSNYSKISFVGDTLEDYNVAIENKIDFIYAAYGYGDFSPGIDISEINKFEELLHIF